jgi:hypothetical protein
MGAVISATATFTFTLPLTLPARFCRPEMRAGSKPAKLPFACPLSAPRSKWASNERSGRRPPNTSESVNRPVASIFIAAMFEALSAVPAARRGMLPVTSTVPLIRLS